MAIYKCKMCGGDLEIADGASVAECEYCGTKQTVPKSMDENLQTLYNRATALRIKCEFDKAEALYEKVVQADETQSDAYWGIILCKNGIEYVDDPATYKKIPTCHRASVESIVADENYKLALQHADASQRAIYEEQAREIDRIQREIVALAQKEETYDVFICYKQSDSEGKRTQDSVIANDIYYQLTQEGFKVFYAAITLEGKLGSAYEPIIFAALNSAKVMLVIGTRPEYFNAVWVKNEWSRFLKIIKADRSKLLIPCYRDMDAYDLPEEFAHLQAQDMSKIGFINDVVRGISKVIKKDEPKPTVVKETVVASGSNNVAPLLERVAMFLEDGDFDRADEFAEQVLNQDPKCAEAYLGKLMAELKVKKRENLKNLKESFNNNNNYQKVIRFGDDKLKSELEGYIDFINERNKNAKLEAAYQGALKMMNDEKNEQALRNAAEKFKAIRGYKDADALTEKCLNTAEEIRKYRIYNEGVSLMRENIADSVEQAEKKFRTIPGYKDADQLRDTCISLIPKLKEKEKAEKEEQERIAEEARIEANRKAEESRIEKEKKIKKIKIIAISAVSSIAVIALLVVFVFIPFLPFMNGSYTKFIKMYGVKKFTVPAGTTEIADDAFAKCDKLEKVILPDSVTKIGKYAFYDCLSLTEVNIPDSVTTIGYSAFRNCESLTEINIPDSVMTIGNEAFGGCESLTEINIPDSVTTISDDAFEYCKSLTKVTIPDSVTIIGGGAFSGCTSLTEINIPDSVTTIGDYAFAWCKSLTEINIPDSVTTIGENAFGKCESLAEVTIGDSVTTIGDSAFYDCKSLTKVTIGNSVTTIGDSAFWGCESLTEINIPDSVTTISDDAFTWCESLTKVIIPDSVTTIGDSAFYSCDSLTIYCRVDSKPAGWNYSWVGYRTKVVWGYTGD